MITLQVLSQQFPQLLPQSFTNGPQMGQSLLKFPIDEFTDEQKVMLLNHKRDDDFNELSLHIKWGGRQLPILKLYNPNHLKNAIQSLHDDLAKLEKDSKIANGLHLEVLQKLESSASFTVFDLQILSLKLMFLDLYQLLKVYLFLFFYNFLLILRNC